MKQLKLKDRQIRIVVIVLALFITGFLGLSVSETRSVLSILSDTPPGYYRVEEFVDGDTIRVDMNGVNETVRFIGLDTPEKNHPEKPVQCFAEAASQHLIYLVGNEPVRLEADPTNQNRDRYNRLLRYVYLQDGTLLNAKQIEDGYGFAYLAFDFVKAEEFEQLEKTARQEQRGLWSDCMIDIENGYINTNPV